MRTGLTKREKTTVIYFDEYGSMIEVQTHNTDLKKRLTAFAKEHPQCCRQIDDDEQGGLTFEIEKGRLSFRLTAPYSEERKQVASEWAKKDGNIKIGRQALMWASALIYSHFRDIILFTTYVKEVIRWQYAMINCSTR